MTRLFLSVGLVFVVATIFGCRAMTKPQASPLTSRMSDLQSALDRREITLDEYERAKHDVIYATRHVPATNAK